MSYCVHCGVKLINSENICPLCGTPVYDLNQLKDDEESIFGNEIKLSKHPLNRRFITLLLSFILLIPFAITALINIFVYSELTWSLYVFGAEVCIWFFAILPIAFPQRRPYLVCILSTFAILSYLLLIFYLTKSSKWFLHLAMPICLFVGSIILIMLYISFRKKLGKIQKISWITLLFALLLCGIDSIIVHFINNTFIPTWSLYVSTPLGILGVVVISLSHNITVTEWIRRNLFI